MRPLRGRDATLFTTFAQVWTTPTWYEAHRMLQRHRELLDARIDRLLAGLEADPDSPPWHATSSEPER